MRKNVRRRAKISRSSKVTVAAPTRKKCHNNWNRHSRRLWRAGARVPAVVTKTRAAMTMITTNKTAGLSTRTANPSSHTPTKSRSSRSTTASTTCRFWAYLCLRRKERGRRIAYKTTKTLAKPTPMNSGKISAR